MRHCLLLGLVALSCPLVGCGDHSDQHSITIVQSGDHLITIDSEASELSHGSLQLGSHQVTIHAHAAPDAVIHANGDFEVKQQTVAVDTAVRELLKSYYRNALTIRTDAVATGKAGAAVGEQAAKSVLARLASGDPNAIQHDIDAKAQLVKEAAAKICQDLRSIKDNQDQLAGMLPAFKPYSHLVVDKDINDCEKNHG